MCGLCGELRFDGGLPDRVAVAAMTDAMRSRGPDAGGMRCGGAGAVGHRRLSIIDLTDSGAQPMIEDRADLTAVFNGCVYNYPELRRELVQRGHRFRSTSDTEVILKAYLEWDERFIERLIGMFPIALWDGRRRRLVLARARFGIKPLYLAQTASRLRFASTLPALLAPGGVDTAIDPVALHHYLSWHSIVPAPRTLLRGVRKLPPATVRVVEADGRSREWTYWRPTLERVADALRIAVGRHQIAAVPVGVLLSGGVDSSLVRPLTSETSGPTNHPRPIHHPAGAPSARTTATP